MYSNVKVISVNPDSTVLVGCSTKACEGCKAQMFCNNKEENSFIVKNPDKIDVKEGDSIRIFLPPSKTIKSTLLVFAFPLCLFPLGYIAFKYLFDFSELINAIAGLGAMALAFGIAAIVSIKKKYELMPVISGKLYGAEEDKKSEV